MKIVGIQCWEPGADFGAPRVRLDQESVDLDWLLRKASTKDVIAVLTGEI